MVIKSENFVLEVPKNFVALYIEGNKQTSEGWNVSSISVNSTWLGLSLGIGLGGDDRIFDILGILTLLLPITYSWGETPCCFNNSASSFFYNDHRVQSYALSARLSTRAKITLHTS